MRYLHSSNQLVHKLERKSNASDCLTDLVALHRYLCRFCGKPEDAEDILISPVGPLLVA